MRYENTLDGFRKWLLSDPEKRNYCNEQKDDDFYFAEAKETDTRSRKGHYLYNHDANNFELCYAITS